MTEEIYLKTDQTCIMLGLEWVNGLHLLPKDSISDQSLQWSDDAFSKESELRAREVLLLPTAASRDH